MKRPIRRVLLALGAVLLVLFLLAWRFTWRSPAYYTAYGDLALPVPVLTQEQYEWSWPKSRYQNPASLM